MRSGGCRVGRGAAVPLRAHVPILGGCTPHRSAFPKRYVQYSVLKHKHTARHTGFHGYNHTLKGWMGAFCLCYLCNVQRLKLASGSPSLGHRLPQHPKAIGDPLAAPPGWHQPLGLPKSDGQGYDRGDPPTRQAQGGRIQSWSRCRQQRPVTVDLAGKPN